MTKRDLIEFVRQTIMAGEITSEKDKYLHPQRVQYFIASAFNTIYYNTFKKDPKELDLYAKNYKAEILYNSERNIYYSNLPKPIVQFPDGGGIRKIGTLQGTKIEFVQTNVVESDIVSNTILSMIIKEIGYIQTNNKIEYRNFDPYLQIKEVFISMVVPFNDLEKTEWVQIPSGKDLELIDIVKQLIMQRQIADKQNDNA